MYFEATKAASLGWLVDFVSSARGDYQQREGKLPTREEDCLTTEAALPELIDRALKLIRSAASNGSLLGHQDLLYILHRWVEFMNNDPSEIQEWTGGLLKEPKALVALARAMTGSSWTMAMGGFGSLGDRVAKRSITAQIREDTNIIDATAFREALESVRNCGELDDDERHSIHAFLDAWNRQKSGDDD